MNPAEGEEPLVTPVTTAVETVFHEGGAPEFATRTKPAVPELASQEGTPELLEIKTPSLAGEIVVAGVKAPAPTNMWLARP